MSFKEFLAFGISAFSLLISIIVLLWGNNVLGRMGTRVDTIEQKTESLSSQIIAIEKSSGTPVTERQVGTSATGRNVHFTNLASMNVALADDPQQEAQVQDWLLNPNSGYPALAEAIIQLMDNRRLKGNAVPLMIVNDSNLRLHRRPTNRPFIDSKEINQDLLKQAIYASWKQKNSSSSLRDFSEIAEPVQQR
jgi:hypothetical protein